MKRKLWVICPLLIALTGCGVANANVQNKPKPQVPNIKQAFLDYIPPNEPVAPHDMEYLVDNFVGDPGYYHSGHIPGTLTVNLNKNLQNMEVTNYYPKKHNEYIKAIYDINWTINSTTFKFQYSLPQKDVTPDNQNALMIFQTAYLQGTN